MSAESGVAHAFRFFAALTVHRNQRRKSQGIIRLSDAYRVNVSRYRSTIPFLPSHFCEVSLDHRAAVVSRSQGIAQPSLSHRSAIARLSSVVRKLSLDHRTAVVCRSQVIARPSHGCRLAFSNYRRQQQSTSIFIVRCMLVEVCGRIT